MFAIIGQEHAFGSYEEDTAVPFRNAAEFPDIRLLYTLMPSQRDWASFAFAIVVVSSPH